MSLLLDACLNYAFSPQQVAVGLAGLIKIGDIVSDIFFILDLKEWHNLFGRSYLFDGEAKVKIRQYLIAAAFFTAVGIAYDMCMCYVVVKDRQKKNTVTERIKRGFRSFAGMFFDADDGKDEQFVWWRHFNLVIEEIPQLIILLCFFANYHRGCEYCTDEQKQYMNSLYISAVVSTVFTCLTIVRVSVGMYRSWRRDRERKGQGMISSVLPTVASKGSDSDVTKSDSNKVAAAKQQKSSEARSGNAGVTSKAGAAAAQLVKSAPDPKAAAQIIKSAPPRAAAQIKSMADPKAAARMIKSAPPKAAAQMRKSLPDPKAAARMIKSAPPKAMAQVKKSLPDPKATAHIMITSAPPKAAAQVKKSMPPAPKPAAAKAMLQSMNPNKAKAGAAAATASDSSCDTTEPERMPMAPPAWKCVVVSELTESLFFCRQQNQ